MFILKDVDRSCRRLAAVWIKLWKFEKKNSLQYSSIYNIINEIICAVSGSRQNVIRYNHMEKSRHIITEQYTILQALERLDEVETKVLFVVRENKLCAAITDGDIRRAILKKVPLSALVDQIAHYNPYYIKVGEEKLGWKLLVEKKILAVPVVNEQFEIIRILEKENKKSETGISGETITVPVAIMAGGKGIRLHPYTKILPKALIPIADVPIVERIILSLEKRGCTEFHMIVNHKRNMIKAYFNDADSNHNICFWEEKKPLGTGGGLYLLKNSVKETFILTNCDILILDDIRKIMNYHKEKRNAVTIVCALQNFEIPYGVVSFLESGELSAFEEKPKMSFFTNTGYYILEPEIFRYIKEDEKMDMPDIIMRMKADNQKIGIYPISENSWMDMGQFDTMETMEMKLEEMGSELVL